MAWLRRRLIALAFLISITLCPFISTNQPIQVQQNQSTLSTTPHGQISVGSDIELSNLVAIEGWSGDGSRSNPYIIEDLEISISGACLRFFNIDSYFIVRNCILHTDAIIASVAEFVNVSHGCVDDCDMTSIQLVNNLRPAFRITNCSDFILSNSTLSASGERGVYLERSLNCTLVFNTLVNTMMEISGSSLEYLSHTILNNTISSLPLIYCNGDSDVALQSGQYAQITLVNCSNSVLEDIQVSNRFYGVGFFYSTNCTLNNSIISGDLAGLSLRESAYCTAANNIFHGGGIVVEGLQLDRWLHTISNNTLHGKDITYLRQQTGVSITSQDIGQLIVADCSDIQIHENSASQTAAPIQIGFSQDCTVSQNTFLNCSLTCLAITMSDECIVSYNSIVQQNGPGIFMSYSDGSFIQSNSLVLSKMNSDDESWEGLIVEYSESVTISANSLYDTGGLICSGLKHSVITENHVSLSTYGLSLVESENCTVSHNNNYYCGLPVYGSDLVNVEFANDNSYGGSWDVAVFSDSTNLSIRSCIFNTTFEWDPVYIWNIINLEFVDNTICNGLNGGVQISDSEVGLIDGNHIFENGGGLSLWGCNHFTISNNQIHDNYNRGVGLYYSKNTSVIGNVIYQNSQEDFRAYDSHYCTILDNNITGHFSLDISTNFVIYGNHLTTAEDNGHSNQWDDGVSRGNYWDLYPHLTSPYTIPGTAGSIDHFPNPGSNPNSTNTDPVPTTWSVLTIIISIVSGAVIVVMAVLIRKQLMD